MTPGRLSLLVLAAVVAFSAAFALNDDAAETAVSPVSVSEDDGVVRRDDDGAEVEPVVDDDKPTGDGDHTKGNDGTNGGDNTGDGDYTDGNDGTAGGDNSGYASVSGDGSGSGGGSTG